MLKTEAFEFDSAPHLTDKQRRKLEKKAERERKKEKNLSSKKQKKMMKEMDENVDMRKIDQYVHWHNLTCLPLSYSQLPPPPLCFVENFKTLFGTTPSPVSKWLQWRSTLGDKSTCLPLLTISSLKVLVLAALGKQL